MQTLYGLFLLLVLVGLFVGNLIGMIFYSYQATNAASHNMLFLFGAVWCTGCCYYTSTVLRDAYNMAKDVVDKSEK